MKSSWELCTETCSRLGIKPTDRLLIVRVATQTLQLYRRGELQRTFVVSTSRRPPSNLKDSLGTPSGLHAIAERIGGEQPAGMVFKSRVPTGHHYTEFSDAERASNLVTTRILWLRGLEPGVNQGGLCDSHDRYIYLHGTNHEDRLGTPQSGGCIVLSNLDIIALFDEVRTGDQVWIEV